MHSARLLIASILLVAGLAAHAADSNPRVQVDTNMGKFVIELDPARAPLTVANFLEYVRSGFYSGTVFHRVIANFIAQAGAFGSRENAEALAGRLSAAGIAGVTVAEFESSGRTLFRVRAGPVATLPEFDALIERLRLAGVTDARLAL